MSLIQPFDFQTLFINTLAGSTDIFILLAAIFIAILSTRFRMSLPITFMVFGLFAILIAVVSYWFMAITVFIGGIAIFYMIGKFWKQ